MIEFLCAIVFTITLFITSALIYAPLEGIANSEQTPNPSKAPWYFLNLQELLLHMDPALAGVIIPSGALLLIGLIPYFDTGTGQMGRWFTSDRGKAVVIFSAVFTAGWIIFLIAFDVLFNLNKILRSTFLSSIKVPIMGGDPTDKFGFAPTSLDVVLGNWVIPLLAIFGLATLLAFIVRKRFGADRRDIFQALFTGFVISYFILTIVGTAMRGPGQDFFWPWAMPPKH
ncbi:MAG: menaquinol-cytochrome C reductase [Chloroflexi bacterium]|nr:menaquinol-cytochrome C reductase [Chloroflexota bacterium]